MLPCLVVVDHRCDHQLVGFGRFHERLKMRQHLVRCSDDESCAVLRDELAVGGGVGVSRRFVRARDRLVVTLAPSRKIQVDGGGKALRFGIGIGGDDVQGQNRERLLPRRRRLELLAIGQPDELFLNFIFCAGVFP